MVASCSEHLPVGVLYQDERCVQVHRHADKVVNLITFYATRSPRIAFRFYRARSLE